MDRDDHFQASWESPLKIPPSPHFSLRTRCTSVTSAPVLPFHVDLRPGLPVYEQVILAVKRALLAGELKPGAPFPSLRKLAEALRINPNTAAKIVSLLKQDGVLVAIPGVGMIVSEDYQPHAAPHEVDRLLQNDLKHLVIEARHLGIDESSFLEAIRQHWRDLDAP